MGGGVTRPKFDPRTTGTTRNTHTTVTTDTIITTGLPPDACPRTIGTTPTIVTTRNTLTTVIIDISVWNECINCIDYTDYVMPAGGDDSHDSLVPAGCRGRSGCAGC